MVELFLKLLGYDEHDIEFAISHNDLIEIHINDLESVLQRLTAAQQGAQRTAVCGCARRTWDESEIGLRCQVCREFIRHR